MSASQELFKTSSLDIIVPDSSIYFPTDQVNDADEWLEKVQTGAVQRRVAFFDEQLQYYLIIHLNDSDSPRTPSRQLLVFLSHLQLSFDVTYISSASVSSNLESPLTATHFSNPSARNPPYHDKHRHPPSIFPPATPHPLPSTAESDRRYVRSEGTLLSAGVWGDNASEDFQLLWSESRKSWIAVYKLVTTVSFVRITFSDPLLCLTVSATLRDIPIPPTGPRTRLAELIDAAGGPQLDPASPLTPRTTGGDSADEDELDGLDEVNLLGALSSVPMFRAEGFTMPSTRLGPVTRHDAFSLPPVTLSVPIPVRSSSLPTLRKSFRKTLKTVSGFRVRMRTVFVPYMIFPQDHINNDGEQMRSYPGSDSDEDEWERERKEAGNDESTVVLCVEIENSGESGMGFTVESVDVNISGSGAKTTLIKWGPEENPESQVFPLLIATREQYNLLYAVAFLESLEVDDSGSINRKQPEMQRAVVININGKPHDGQGSNRTYPTGSFSSRWNCVLDLSANINKELVDVPMEASFVKGSSVDRDALPVPPSPFPGPNTSTTRMRSNTPHIAQPQETKSTIIASGNKRHTLTSFVLSRTAVPKSPVDYRSSISMLNPALQQEKDPYPPYPVPHTAGGFTLPSVTLQQSTHRPPTTYGPKPKSPPPLAPPFDFEMMASPPITPAYPAFPNSPPEPFPVSQTPVVGVTRRGAGAPIFGANAGGVGDSTGTVPTAVSVESEERNDGEPVVVSIGLLPLPVSRLRNNLSHGGDVIYPNDKFTLDIFVFNKSSWIRRFEISYLDERSWRRRPAAAVGGSEELGVMPLENRIRIGPLRPSTCQSVRMDFLALVPGIYPVDTLTLTDIETGYAVNLKSVMDIVVHELPES